MKKLFISLAAATLIAGMGSAAIAQETTVIHKESADGDSKTVVHKESADGEHSKTVIARDDDLKTIVKRGTHHMKKVDINANGDKTVVKKTTD